MENTVTFTTTAMARPEILEQTYYNFQICLNINMKDFDLRINVDPLPKINKVDEVVNVAKKFFKNVDYNISKDANFPSAIKWCWMDLHTKYTFHLEDDWELTRGIPLYELVKMLESNKDINQVLLRPYLETHKVSLVPGLIRSDVAMYLSRHMLLNKNPEKQIHSNEHTGKDGDPGFDANKVIVYPEDVCLRDIGRVWMKSQSVIRPGPDFVKWEKKKDIY
jgi:hypothetical protein